MDGNHVRRPSGRSPARSATGTAPGTDCPDVLAEENRERADAFFRRLVADGKVDAYLAGVAKRATIDSVQAIADRIRAPDAGNV